MSINETKNTGKINLYACGGAGLNIASHFEKYRNQTDVGFASIETCYIDTSRSNVKETIAKDDVYILEGLDGSGKVRAENHKQIAECVLDILQKHKPGDINVILSSGSGGSGSVIAPSLVSELLSRNIPIIVIIVGSTDSRIELENTIKTLKSYESIAQMRKVPVNAFYVENSKSNVRSVVDNIIQSYIVSLSVLFSKQNKELDSSDLYNWLYYTKVTSYAPRLSYVEFFPKIIELQKNSTIISVATLATIGNDTSTGSTVEYQCVGYTSEDVMKSFHYEAPVHVAILDGVFSEIHNRLSTTLADMDEVKKARITKSSILNESDRPTLGGLVL